MAEENEDQDSEQEDSETSSSEGGGKKKLILFIVIGVIAVAASIGGTLFMLGFFDSDEAEEAETEQEEVAEEVVNTPSPAMYFPIKPAFRVTFPSRGKQRYLETNITVLTRDMDVFNAMSTHLPLIKNRMVMMLGGEVYEELQTDEGKELLRQKVLQALQELMQQEVGKAEVEEVLFTSFVMQ